MRQVLRTTSGRTEFNCKLFKLGISQEIIPHYQKKLLVLNVSTTEFGIHFKFLRHF